MGTRKENLLKRAKRTAELEIKTLPNRIKKATEKGETRITISFFSVNETNGSVFGMIKEWADEKKLDTGIEWNRNLTKEEYSEDILIISWET